MVLPAKPVRPRNAAATRAAILLSARHQFATQSYENVGVREIAGDAGVDPALVNRYFGGKEALFREVLRGDKKDILDGLSAADLPARLASLLDEDPCGGHDMAEKVDRMLIILHSASSPTASEIVRGSMNADMLEPIAALLDGDDARIRASMTVAVLMGTAVMRTVMAVEPMCTSDPDVVRAKITDLFAAAVAPSSDGRTD